MPTLPWVHFIQEGLGLSEKEAKDLKKGMKLAAGDPEKVDELLDKVNSRIKGLGIEAIRGDGPGGYYMDILLLYVNRGETYQTTVLYDTHEERFLVGSWGDWVEEFGERYSVE